MDPGYELYLKLMTEFPLPDDQHGLLDNDELQTEGDSEVGVDTSTNNNSRASYTSRANACTRTHLAAVARPAPPETSTSESVMSVRSSLQRSAILVNHNALHESGDCSLLKEQLETCKYVATDALGQSSNVAVMSNTSTQNESDQARSTTRSHSMPSEDVEVLTHSVGGMSAAGTPPDLDPAYLKSLSNKSTGRALGQRYLCESDLSSEASF